MKIYVDYEYRCHATNTDGTLREVETNFFDGKCTVFIEGYRYIPEGESWTRSDGVVVQGIAPFKPVDELENTQREYEKQLLAEYAEALETVGVEV